MLFGAYLIHCFGGYSFPVLSCLARLVILAASAESERHFSGAGKIAHKDRNRLKENAVESLVVYYEAVRKGIIQS